MTSLAKVQILGRSGQGTACGACAGSARPGVPRRAHRGLYSSPRAMTNKAPIADRGLGLVVGMMNESVWKKARSSIARARISSGDGVR
jgi:hypothetical protein